MNLFEALDEFDRRARCVVLIARRDPDAAANGRMPSARGSLHIGVRERMADLLGAEKGGKGTTVLPVATPIICAARPIDVIRRQNSILFRRRATPVPTRARPR